MVCEKTVPFTFLICKQKMFVLTVCMVELGYIELGQYGKMLESYISLGAQNPQGLIVKFPSTFCHLLYTV